MKNIFNELPYKIKISRNPEEIIKFLSKQIKRDKILAIGFLILGLLNLGLFIMMIEDNKKVSTLYTIALIIQIVIFPLLSYKLFKKTKQYSISENEVKEYMKTIDY